MPNKKLLYEKEVYDITGAAMAVYNNLGIGFLEAVYQEAFEIELRKRNIPFESQKSLKISYQGKELSKTYVADLICYGEIIVELKAISALSKTEEAQLINYLKASGKQVGLRINYGNERKLEWKRYIFTNTTYQTKQNIPEKSDQRKEHQTLRTEKKLKISNQPSAAPEWRRPAFAVAFAISNATRPLGREGERRIANAIRGGSAAAEIRADSRSVYPHPATLQRLPNNRNPPSYHTQTPNNGNLTTTRKRPPNKKHTKK